jgi:UDP-glucuronate decarboxylase
VRLDSLSGATVLVTGASGLIGSHLLSVFAAFKDRGGKVVLHAQSLSDPPPHLAALMARSGVRHMQSDLSDFRHYDRLPSADVVVHAAGYAQPLRFMSNPGATLQLGAAATLALLQRLRAGGHFLFLSSSQVYTGRHEVVCTEAMVGTTTPAHPRGSYIEGKRAGEAGCHAFRAKGVHATAARLGDVYGPGTRPHDKRALNSFIEQALTKAEIRLLDAGTAVRTFGYVADVVEMLLEVLLRGRETVYNVGGRSVTTIAELASTIGGLTGVPVAVGPQTAGVAGAPEALRLDVTRFEGEFGRRPSRGLREGLATTIEWQRGLYQR